MKSFKLLLLLSLFTIGINLHAQSDLSILSVTSISEEYTKIPRQHYSANTPSVWVKNEGSLSLNNVKVIQTVYYNGSVIKVDSSTSFPTLNVADSISLTLSSSNYGFTGDYFISYEAKFNGTDANPANNTMNTDTLIITDSTFARDNGIAAGGFGLGAGVVGEIGTIFETLIQDTITTVSVYFENPTPNLNTGKPIFIRLRDVNGFPQNVIATSDTAVYPAISGYVDFTFNNAGGYVVVPADTFYIGVEENASINYMTLGYSNSIYTPRTSLVYAPGVLPNSGWEYAENLNFNVAIMINPNFKVSSSCNIAADFAFSSPSVCKGSNLAINNSTIGASSNTTYQWDIGNDGSIDYTTQNISHLFNSSGNIPIAMIAVDGSCIDTIVKTILVESVDTSITQNANLLTANQANASYQWLNCNSNGYTAISGATSQSYTATSNGDYAVAINFNNCSDTSRCIQILGVGISEVDQNDFRFYPNPANDIVNIEFASFSQNRELLLRDIQGKLIFRMEANQAKYSLDLNYAEGLYFVEIMEDGNRVVRRLIIK